MTGFYAELSALGRLERLMAGVRQDIYTMSGIKGTHKLPRAYSWINNWSVDSDYLKDGFQTKKMAFHFLHVLNGR